MLMIISCIMVDDFHIFLNPGVPNDLAELITKIGPVQPGRYQYLNVTAFNPRLD